MENSNIKELLRKLPETEWRKLFPGFKEEDFKRLLNKSEHEILSAVMEQTEHSTLVHADTKRWFDKPLSGLSKDGIAHLKELEMPNPGHTIDRKQIRYLKQLRDIRLTVPKTFREVVNAKVLYRSLLSFCEDNDIPEEIMRRVVPALVSYIETGRLRPIIFVGEKGCGKTTAIRLLLEEALKLPTAVIKIPQTDGSHGMTGDCGSYVSADAGCIAKARLSTNSLLVAYVFDEIDKASHDRNRASVDDELLSITDESCNGIYDNYLETTIVGLEHNAI